eukprot:6310404-Alexandrium_andersonii.AAC.1
MKVRTDDLEISADESGHEKLEKELRRFLLVKAGPLMTPGTGAKQLKFRLNDAIVVAPSARYA